METYWNLIIMYENDCVTHTESYEDFDDARADFNYWIQECPQVIKYIILQEVITDHYDSGIIVTIDSWYKDL